MTYRSEVLADSPQSYWRLGDVEDDARAADIGAVGYTLFGPQNVGAGLIVAADGSISLSPDFAFLRTNPFAISTYSGLAGVSDFTLEWWMDTFSTPADDYMFNYSVVGANDEIGVFFTNATTIGFDIAGSSGSLMLGAAIDDGLPHHIVLRWRNSDGAVHLWQDGVQVDTTTGIATGLTISSGGYLTVGAKAVLAGPAGPGTEPPVENVNGTQIITSQVDEFAIYDTFLADGRIETHYEWGTTPYSLEVLADLPAAYWRLGESAGTTAVDETGNGHDLTYVNSPTLGASGLLAGDPDTSVTFVAASETRASRSGFTGLDGATEVTVEAWISTNNSGLGMIVEYGDAVTMDSLVLFHATGGELRYLIDDQGSVTIPTPPVVDDGLTHHLVFRWRGSDGAVSVHLDGIEIHTNTGYATGSSLISGGFLNLAANSNDNGSSFIAGQFYDGVMDEVSVYPSFLSDARVVLHWHTGSSLLEDFPTHVTRAYLVEAGRGESSWYFDDIAFYLPLDEEAGGSVTDVIGSLTGTFNNAPTLGVDAQIGTGLSFTNVDDQRVSFGTNTVFDIFGKTGMSWEFWVFQRTSPNPSDRLIEKHSGGINGYYVTLTTGGGVQFILQTTGGTLAALETGYGFNTWEHVVFTWDGEKIRLYRNGVLRNTSAALGGDAVNDDTAEAFFLGDNQGAANRCPDCIVDNLAIYHRVLTEEEIRRSHQHGLRGRPLQTKLVTTQHYPFDGNANDVVSGDNGTLVSSVSFSTGKVNSAADFTGGRIEVSDSGTLRFFGSDYSWDCWVFVRSVGNDRVWEKFGQYVSPQSFGSGYRVLFGKSWATVFANATSGELPFNQWVYLAGTLDSSTRTLRLYVNGAFVAQVVGGAGAEDDDTGLPLHFGDNPNSPGGTFVLDGMVDEARFDIGTIWAPEVIKSNYFANFDRFRMRLEFFNRMGITDLEDPANYTFSPPLTIVAIVADVDQEAVEIDVAEVDPFVEVYEVAITSPPVIDFRSDALGNPRTGVRVQPGTSFISTPFDAALDADFVGSLLQGDVVPVPGSQDASLPFVSDVRVRRIAYLMRAFKNTPTTGFVFWQVLDEPDFAAANAPVPAGELEDIVVDDTYVVQA